MSSSEGGGESEKPAKNWIQRGTARKSSRVPAGAVISASLSLSLSALTIHDVDYAAATANPSYHELARIIREQERERERAIYSVYSWSGALCAMRPGGLL